MILKQAQGYDLRKFLSQKVLVCAQLGPGKLLLCNCPVCSFFRCLPLTTISDKKVRMVTRVSRLKHLFLFSLTIYYFFFSLRHMDPSLLLPKLFLANRKQDQIIISEFTFIKLFCVCNELASTSLYSSVSHAFS